MTREIVRLTWNPQFQLERERLLGQGGEVQKYIDSTVLNTISPYVPRLSGDLIKSAQIHTVVGRGIVKWVTPYARKQYYKGRTPPGGDTGRRGRLWCERWKTDNKARVLAGVRSRLRGGIT